MTRAFIFVLDSFGVGGAPDAASFGDEGANTLGHIAERCAAGDADRNGTRHGPLRAANRRDYGVPPPFPTLLSRARDQGREVVSVGKIGDLAIVTGDHGCDPTWPGSDHTRECIPVLAFGPSIARGEIGKRSSFADIGATLADHLGLPAVGPGHSFAW